MAAISPAVALSLAESSLVAILPANDATMMQANDADPSSAPVSPVAVAPTTASATGARIISDESTQGALDALAALAAASTAVSSVSSSEPPQPPSAQLHRPQEITPHQTSSDDDDSEIMPPPPPRSPTTISLSAAAAAAATSPACPASAPAAVPSFTFLHDNPSYQNYSNGNNFGNNAVGGGGGGRLRSASNPEGMEKWDFYSRRNDRQHFVLPSSILEEELASTRRVLGEVVDEGGEEYNSSMDDTGVQISRDISDSSAAVANQHGFTSRHQQSTQPQQQQQQQKSSVKKTDAATGFQQHWVRRSKRTIAARFGTSPDSVSSDFLEQMEDVSHPPSTITPKSTSSKSKPAKSPGNGNRSSSADGHSSSSKPRKKSSARSVTTATSSPPDIISSQSPPPDEDDVDESTLEPEELLRRARSRLLEDLSEGSGGGNGNGVNGEKGGSVLILPHSLSKYKEVYNKNGRIGIYTPAERAAIIQKFNAKRARRVWNKKIRYNCRKNLADRRMRVKGRFVKRSVESGASGGAGSPPPLNSEKEEDKEAVPSPRKMVCIRAKASSPRSNSPPTSGSPLPTVNEHDEDLPDEEMPDVKDEEAGFQPSDDMPYRRARRYTIT